MKRYVLLILVFFAFLPSVGVSAPFTDRIYNLDQGFESYKRINNNLLATKKAVEVMLGIVAATDQARLFRRIRDRKNLEIRLERRIKELSRTISKAVYP